MEVVGTCPECQSPLVVKRSRTGSRFIACSAYPKCRYAAPFSTGVACPQCGEGEIVEKSTKKGKIFYSCSRYPQCEFALWNEPVPEKCPECGSPYLVLRRTRQGVRKACPSKDCGYAVEADGESGEAGAGTEGA